MCYTKNIIYNKYKMSISSLLATDGQTTQKKTLVVGGVVLLFVISIATVSYAFSGYLKTSVLLNGKSANLASTPIPVSPRSVAAVKVPVVNIAYYDAKDYDLKFATNNSGSWATARVDSPGKVGQDTSLAVDSKGKMHVAYYDDAPKYDLKYATNASGSWVTTIVDSAGNVGWYPSIAVDGNDKVYIAYADNINKDLKFATNVSGGWITSIVDKGVSSLDVPGRYISLALDKNAKAHVGYQFLSGGSIGSLRYATNSSGVWVTSILDKESYSGFGVSTKTDALGKVHMSYYGQKNPKYINNVSGKWVGSLVDSKPTAGIGIVGFNTSLALDVNNIPYVCFTGGASIINYQLKCLSMASGGWQPLTTIGQGKVGTYNSLGIDDKNNLYVSYYDAIKRTLEFATNTSGSWVTTTVDNESPVGMWTSLAVSYNYVVPPTPPAPYGPYTPATPLIPYGPYTPPTPTPTPTPPLPYGPYVPPPYAGS